MDNNISVVKRRNSRLNMWGSKNKKESLVRDDTCMILLRHLIELILSILDLKQRFNLDLTSLPNI